MKIEVMLDFAKFIEGAFPETKKKNLKVWCKGGSFDFPILNLHLNAHRSKAFPCAVALLE
ncbi:Uncharacterised protein [Klebsiella aerogenes]|nr:Uncharacterised protein [Klebsiella aerogenes]